MKYEFFEKALNKRIEQEQYRQMRLVSPQKESATSDKVNFGTSDFLGLAQNPLVKKKTIEYVLQWGVGSTATRLSASHLKCQKLLEEKLASMIACDATLLFPSAIQACTLVLSTILNARGALFIDDLSPMPLVQAAITSGVKPTYFSHGDLCDLREKLNAASEAPMRVVIVESLSSIEGDRADLAALLDVVNETHSLLFVDDSLSLGVLGKNGMGLAAAHHGIDFVMGAFGKASGCYGAYIGCNQLMYRFFSHFCDGIATPLPPAALGAIDATTDLIPKMDAERELIAANSRHLREILNETWDTCSAEDHIIPIAIPQDELYDISELLASAGYIVP
ncbi:MAG: pyridoxal phosphate-dependent aminotransferase family protein, partial [Simkaniaceae bacterium]|nr:pyridoxal phosphate-dependent aminotransferase family protein [Simkaniaceae bacterium]